MNAPFIFSSGQVESEENEPEFGYCEYDGKQYKSEAVLSENASHLEMLWKWLTNKEETTPDVELPQEKLVFNNIVDSSDDQLKVAWLGHSSLLVNIDGQIILTDPVFERKVSIVGPTRFHEELPLEVESLEKVDAVIISHDHYDHLNKFSIKKLAGKTGLFFVPMGVGERLKDWDIPKEKIVEMNWWEEMSLTPAVTIAATPAQHFSGRSLFDRNRTLWASWVIMSENHRLFFGGDSGYFQGFKAIGNKYGPFDMTFIECGAYNERWSNIHMFPEQTVQAHIDLKGKVLQPIHWATFNLSLHAWYEPMERLLSAAWKSGVSISTPVPGSIVDYKDERKSEIWWVEYIRDEREEEIFPKIATDMGR